DEYVRDPKVTSGALLGAREEVVRVLLRGSDAGPDPWLAGDCLGCAHPDLRADRLRQDARGVPVGNRPPGARARAPRLWRPDRLRVAAEGALLRHRAKPAGAAAGDRRLDLRRPPHGRHAAVRAPRHAPRAA